MRIALVIIFCFASIFSQSDTSEEDILEDTLIPSESTEFDTNTEIEPEQTFQIIIQKKIEFYREISIGNTWLLYDTLKPEYFLHYTYRIGFGISGGVVVNLKKPFRLRAGLRIYQSGNKLNVSGDFYRVNYDSVTNEPIDSLLVHQKGYFKLAQYLISMPVTIDIFLKNIPFYIITGFEPGYVISASSSGELSDNGKKWWEEISVSDRSLYKKFNYVINNGIGFQFNIQNKYYSELQLLFSWGLFHINKPDIWHSDFKTREISLRYLFVF